MVVLRVRYKEKDRKIKLDNKPKVLDVIKAMNINPTTVVAVINNEVVVEDRMVQDKDYIELLSVISGG